MEQYTAKIEQLEEASDDLCRLDDVLRKLERKQSAAKRQGKPFTQFPQMRLALRRLNKYLDKAELMIRKTDAISIRVQQGFLQLFRQQVAAGERGTVRSRSPEE
jgi:hypothetical protein